MYKFQVKDHISYEIIIEIMKYVTDINQLDFNKTYTYADYLTWRFKERVELLWGRISKMSAAPSTRHQKILGKLYLSIGNCLEKHPCQVFIAPFDVRLPLGDEVNSVIQPDLCVVCNKDKIDDKGCFGAPDLIVEVLSPSSSKRDVKDKLKLYQQAGVTEYWIVNPHDGIINVFVLDEKGNYQSRYPVSAEDELQSEAIPDLVIKLENVFPDILKEEEVDYGPNTIRWD